MTSPVSAIEAIEKAMEGVTNRVTWSVEGYDEDTGQVNVVGDGFFIAGVIANQPDQEATAAYIAVCNPVAMREVLALARQAEALQRENAEFAKAGLEVLNAVRDYLPPDGISAKDCLSRVIGAVDNGDINPLIKKLERADVDA